MTGVKGRTAIVTGSARGIGREIAFQLAAQGAQVVVNYMSSVDDASTVVTNIIQAGGAALSIQADVSKPEGIQYLFERAESQFGEVSILVNNAGLYEHRLLEEVDLAHFEKVIGANTLSVLLCTSEFSRRLKSSKWGRVVNISSGAARDHVPGNSVYSASKAALEALTRVHAAELGSRNITVNAVAPGLTESVMATSLPSEVRIALISSTILGRLGQPDDIAQVVQFLCSDEGRWITGQVIDANGGRKR
jgi:3-oxoacyl-[acyl-carrier protein] reductase